MLRKLRQTLKMKKKIDTRKATQDWSGILPREETISKRITVPLCRYVSSLYRDNKRFTTFLNKIIITVHCSKIVFRGPKIECLIELRKSQICRIFYRVIKLVRANNISKFDITGLNSKLNLCLYTCNHSKTFGRYTSRSTWIFQLTISPSILPNSLQGHQPSR